MRVVRALVPLLLILATPSAPAQQLLVTNSSFESGLTSWTLTGAGTAVQQSVTVHFGAGAAQVSNNGSSGDTELISECVAITTGQAYNWGVWSFVPSGQEVGSYNQVQLYWCNSALCNTCNSSPGAMTSSVTNAWEHLTVTGTVAPAATYAHIFVRNHAASATAFTSFFDDAHLGIGITPAMLQSFSVE